MKNAAHKKISRVTLAFDTEDTINDDIRIIQIHPPAALDKDRVFDGLHALVGDSSVTKLCREAFQAGQSYAISSHKDFTHTHPNFGEWMKQKGLV